jgi:2-phospho-L-lactate/phosphoenolpyruvate guanylyltransferase
VTTPRLSLLVPVKDGHGAKTRLDDVGPSGRSELMAAFARDAITAARRTPLVQVYVVGDAVALAPVVGDLGVEVVPDEGKGDLNLALRRAAARLERGDRGLAVMLADLPCLRTEDLDQAITDALSGGSRAFVADAAGTGTTLLVAGAGQRLDPRFGPGSADAHTASGARALDAALRSLRLDVDTRDDLDRALQLGVGPNTAAAARQLHRANRPQNRSRSRP